MKHNSTIVSVVLIGEAAAPEAIQANLSNITQQTHKNLDILVAYTIGSDISSLVGKWMNSGFNIRWIACNNPLEFFTNPLKEAVGEYIFYKSTNPTIWYPRHIEHHLDLFHFQKGKATWSYSYLEYRNLDEQGQYINALGWRITNDFPLEQIIVDELVHHVSINPEWNIAFMRQNDRNVFIPGAIVHNWRTKHRFVQPEEVTVMQWIKQQAPQNPALELGKPISDANVEEKVNEVNGELEVSTEYPTLVGNIFHLEHNQKILKRLENVKPENIKTIALKRTIGMGDVLLTEPVLRALKKKYVNAKITMYTGNSRGANDIVQYFETVPDLIIPIPENSLTQDILYGQKGFDLRFDLDLSYESRKMVNYIDAYFETCGFEEKVIEKDGNLTVLKYVEKEEKVPRLVYDKPKEIEGRRYFTVEVAGSGWPGKEWDFDKWKSVIEHLQYKCGLTPVYVSGQRNLTSGIANDKNDFDKLINFIKYGEFHIGADNGPMHIAAAFNKPCFIIAGTALPQYTSYSDKIYQVSNKSLPCLHCKGRQFYNDNGQGGITFVSKCEQPNDKQFICMKDLSLDYIMQELNKFLQENIQL